MALETAVTLDQLNPSYPSAADRLHQGDDHIRLIKRVLKNTFPNITGPMLLTQDEIADIQSRAVPTGAISLWFGTPATCPVGWAICDGSLKPKADGSGTIPTPNVAGKALMGVLAGTYDLGESYGSLKATPRIKEGGAHDHGLKTGDAGGHDHNAKTGSTTLTEQQIPSHSHLNFVANSNPSAELNDTATKTGSVLAASNTGGDTEYSLNFNSNAPTPDRGPSGKAGGGLGHDHSIAEEDDHWHSISAVGDHMHDAEDINLMQPSFALYLIIKL